MLSNAPVREMVGPVGSGKSSCAVVEMWRRAHEIPPGSDGIRRSRGLVVRNTYPELRDTTIKTFEHWIKPWMGHWKVSEHTFVLRVNDVECEVLFRSLDTPADVKKLLSLELTFAWINEAKEVPRPVFDMLQTRIGRYPAHSEVPFYWSGMWADTNPPDNDHYLYTVFEEERPDGFEVFKQPGGRSENAENLPNLEHCPGCLCPQWAQNIHLADCKPQLDERGLPLVHLPLCICYYTAKARGKPKDWINVNIDGNYGFVKEGKPIYPEWQDDIHVRPVSLLPSTRVLVLGNDFGLTPAAVWVQVDPRDGQYQVLRELVSDHLGAVNFGAEQERVSIQEFLNKPEGGRRNISFRGWGDPSGTSESQVDERTPFEVLPRMLNIAPAPTNDPMRRREAVAKKLTTLTMLGRPALVIDPSCTRLRKAMAGGYCYRRLEVSGAERYSDEPLKNMYSHVAEALQYAMVGEGEDQDIFPTESPSAITHMRVRKAGGEIVVPEPVPDGQGYMPRYGVKKGHSRR